MEGTNTNTNSNCVEVPLNLSFEELEQTMSKVVSNNPNKQDIQSSNEILKRYSKNLQSVEGYLLQIKLNKNERIRQLAAILLYRKLEKHWVNLDDASQVTLKNLILELLSTEKNYLVLKAIANLVYRIAKLNLINKEWTDLLEYVFSEPSKYNESQAFLFELNLYVISSLIESCSLYLVDKLERIKLILATGLNHGSQKMKENSTKCLGNLVRNLEKEQLPVFKDLIPCIFKEINSFSEETILHIFETFCDFHINSLDFFSDYFDEMIPISLNLLQNQETYGNTKLVISEFLLMIGECKKKFFTKNECHYLKMALGVAYKLACSDDEAEKNALNLEDDSLSDYSIGLRMIDSFSQILQSKYIFPICSSYIQTLISGTNSRQRRAAVASLGAITEGCCEKIRDMLPQAVDTLVNLFINDPDIKVKSAVILTLDQFTQYCAPEINEYHSKIIPMLNMGLSSNGEQYEEIIEKSLIELNYFCRNLDYELEDYVGELLPKLIHILTTHKSVKVQEECLFALASIISSAQNLIGQTLFPILETCKNIIVQREEEIDLRANALDCVGHIAFVIKLEKFMPYMEFFTNFAFSCIKSDKYEYQDAGFTYFGALAGIMNESIATDLPVLMSSAFQVLKDESGMTHKKDGDEFGMDSDSEEEGMEGKIGDVYVSDSFVDAKCSAILAITNFAKACPEAFLPYVEEVFILFDSLWNYIHDNINVELIGAYQSLMVTVHNAEMKINNPNTPVQERLSYKIWTKEVFSKYEDIFENSDVKEENCKMLEALRDVIDDLGSVVFQGNNTMERIMNMCVSFLENKAVCQVKDDDEEEDPDHDAQLLGNTVDIFLISSEKFGNEFHPYFSTAFPSLKKYLSVKRSESDRSMIFGCLADTLKHCKISTKFYSDILVSACEENINKNLKRKDEDLFRHIAYLIGVLFESDASSVGGHLENTLKLLNIIFENSTRTAKDNVIAALCRISYSMNLVSVEWFSKILETIFTNCPLKNDPMENPSIFKLVAFLADKVDMGFYEKYLENILLTLKMLVLNEIKCGTSKPLIVDIRSYLELLNNNQILKSAIEKFVEGMSEQERERFVNSIRNA